MTSKSGRTIAITGATGFVGSALTRMALDQGWCVRALVRNPDAVPRKNGLQVVRWSVGNDDTLAAVAGADVVCHLAAYIPSDFADPCAAAECFETNTLGTLSLVRACEEASVANFVYTSSGNVYTPRSGLVSEGASTYPSQRASYYLSSKLAAEVLVDHRGNSGPMRTNILRVSSVYGPGMTNRGLIPSFTQRLLDGHTIDLHDGGRYAVDLVLVQDVARAVLLAAECSDGGIFNIGSGIQSSVHTVAQLLLQLTGGKNEQVNVLPAQPGAPVLGFAGLDVTHAREVLGYVPTPLEIGLSSYVASLRG